MQPFFAELSEGGLAIAHNGNITNAMTVQRSLQKQGAIFSSTSDTETILHLVATSKERDINSRFIEAIRQLEGAFSLVALTSKKMIGCRDPLGIRPLVLGDLDGSWILASETCALDIIGARFVRDLKPGEMVVVTSKGIESLFPFEPQKSRFCVFEYVYFARPDSSVEGRNVYDVRKRIGAELARRKSGRGRHRRAGARFRHAGGDRLQPGGGHSLRTRHHPQPLCRPHLHLARRFDPPHGRRLKHNANRRIIEGKRVVLVDDSIVRGTTSQKIVQMVRDAGAREVHMRIASPPTRASCFYGVDTPEKAKLLASRMSVEEMAGFIRVDSLGFLSLDGLYRAVGEEGRNTEQPQFCDACFSTEYPTRLTDFDGADNVRTLSLLATGGL